MKEYIIYVLGITYIVSAKNSKDAITYFVNNCERIKNISNPALKKRLVSKITARSIGSLHNEKGKLITL